MQNPAFTLIELLVVIVIIGVLATVSTVTYRGQIEKANETKDYAECVQNLKESIASCVENQGGDCEYDPEGSCGEGGGLTFDYKKCATFYNQGWATLSGEYETWDASGAISEEFDGMNKNQVWGLAEAYCGTVCANGDYLDLSIRPDNTAGRYNLYCAGTKTPPYAKCGRVTSDFFGTTYYDTFSGTIPTHTSEGYMVRNDTRVRTTIGPVSIIEDNCEAECANGYSVDGVIYYCNSL